MISDLEGTQVKNVISALNARFPELPIDLVAHEVELQHQQFEGAKVRTFIPVLVQHQVRETLRLHGGR